MKTGKQILEETGIDIELPAAYVETLAKAIDDNIKQILANGCSHVWHVRQVGNEYSPCEAICIYCGKKPDIDNEKTYLKADIW